MSDAYVADATDELSDDDFMAAIDEAGSAPVETETEENVEDTDQVSEETEETVEEEETNESIDDETQETETETEETVEEGTEENTQVDESGETEESENADAETEEETGTEEEANAETETDEIDYKAQYAELMAKNTKLQGFYDEVTSEFVANGKTMKGFDDPKKIIQSQQMAAGFAEKMAGFKQYRPFMTALKEKGFLDNPEKFNMAMNLLDGDPEAIKQQLKNLEIDPVEMDMENIAYEPKNQVTSDLEMAFDDMMDSAESNNVGTEVRNIISKDWDDESVVELLGDPKSSADLVNHISSGAYKVVQERIAEKKRTDVDQSFTAKPVIEQYREAAAELEGEYIANHNAEVDAQDVKATEDAKAETKKQDEYRAKVEKKNATAATARKKATSVSKKKTVTKVVKKEINPDDMSDDEITAFLDNIMYKN